MPAPSQLAIATSAVNRLVKEEASYHKEMEQQQARIEKLERGDSSDENADPQRKVLEETKAVFPSLNQRIKDALAKLEQQLEQDKGPGDQSTPEEITKAKEAIAAAKKGIRETM
ncbi:tubulin folding cofactor A [Taxawa tesnikishii (nom. ined.)]|nr:tubulin folding cofactor A [Dothideales sp. JES 119]